MTEPVRFRSSNICYEGSAPYYSLASGTLRRSTISDQIIGASLFSQPSTPTAAREPRSHTSSPVVPPTSFEVSDIAGHQLARDVRDAATLQRNRQWGTPIDPNTTAPGVVHKRRAAYDASKSAILALMASLPIGSGARQRPPGDRNPRAATSDQYSAMHSAGLYRRTENGGLHTVEECVPSLRYRSATAMALRTPETQPGDSKPASAVSEQQRQVLPLQQQLQQQLALRIAAPQRTASSPESIEGAPPTSQQQQVQTSPPRQQSSTPPIPRTPATAESAPSAPGIAASASASAMAAHFGGGVTSQDGRHPTLSPQSSSWEMPDPEGFRKGTASPAASVSPSMTHDSGFRHHMQVRLCFSHQECLA